MTQTLSATRLSLVAALCTWPSLAAAFEPLKTREAFLSVISGKELTRMGIALDVKPTGEIQGRAFGTPVTGAWQWRDGYFCRSLYYGQRNLGDNCQLVQKRGDTLRFTLDRGAGDYADLRLR